MRDIMVTGINENVEVLGRTYHVQTELTPGAAPQIRTSVFLDGRTIASRTNPVSSDVTDAEVRRLIEVQQAQIIDNFVTRAAVLAEGEDADDSPTPVSQPTRLSPPAVMTREPPDPEADPAVAEAIAVRRLITGFRQSISQSSAVPDVEIEPFLKKVVRAIRTVTEDPVFIDVRLDEQVAFYDLKSRIATQLQGEIDIEACRSLCTELSRFSGYLGRINQRRELVAFDRKLFTWALTAIGSSGLNDEVVDNLDLARGRNGDLDRFLDRPDVVSSDRWLEILMQLIDTTFGDHL